MVVEHNCKVGRQFPPVIDVAALPPSVVAGPSDTKLSYFDGEKYPFGFGTTHLFQADYWTLRNRSAQLFKENLYARGLIRRLVTNEITTGLELEATPNTDILGLSDDFRNGWSESTENRFKIWAKNPELCDFHGEKTFSELQKSMRREALIEGDILVVLEQSRIKARELPMVRLVPGGKVTSPFAAEPRAGNKIEHGIELNSRGRQVAFWVTQDDGTSKRVPAFGERTGRRKAWMYYGTDKRFGEVRGEPMLSLVLQSLKEVDRYRDSAQRKATINSTLAMYISKTEDKPGTRPMTGGAMRRQAYSTTDPDGTTRRFNTADQIPGLVLDELQQGEKPEAFNSGADVNYPQFEAAIIYAVAWANEVPPEIMTLVFQSNYSASRGAQSEFKIYLNSFRASFSERNLEPVYQEWLLSEVLLQKISAPGFLEAWRDPSKYDIYGAWVSSEWSGAIKPSVDMGKEVKAYQAMNSEGWVTSDRATRELTGMKFSKNIARLKQENKLKLEAMQPIIDEAARLGVPAKDLISAMTGGDVDAMADVIMDALQQN